MIEKDSGQQDDPVPPKQTMLKVGTFNAATNLHKLAEHVHDFMLEESLDCLLLSDPGRGITEDTRRALSPFVLIVNRSGGSNRSTAILLHERLKCFGSPIRDPSGGFLAQDIKLADENAEVARRIRLIAVYQPPGAGVVFSKNALPPPRPERERFDLEHTGTLKGKPLLTESNRMREVLRDWSKDKDLDSIIAGGDFNEALQGRTDRITRRASKALTWGSNAHWGPLRELLETDEWGVDLYAHAHPPATRAHNTSPRYPEDSHKYGHTFFGNFAQGSARLGYILVRDRRGAKAEQLSLAPIAPVTNTSNPITNLTDHVPLCCSLPLAPAITPLTSHILGAIRTKHLTDEDYQIFHHAINERLEASGEHLEWISALRALDAMTRTADKEVALESTANQIQAWLLTEGRRTCGATKTGPSRRRTKRTKRQRHAAKVYKAVVQLYVALKSTQETHVESLYSKLAVKQIRCIKHLHARKFLLGLEKTSLNDAGAWNTWLDSYPETNAEARKEVSDADKASPHSPLNIRREQFRSSLGRGTFYKSAFASEDGAKQQPISGARDERGVLQQNPDVYKDIISQAAAKTFSNPKLGPATPRWRDTSEDEERTGVPDWWNKMYERNAAGLPLNTWDTLMIPTTVHELLEVLGNAKNGVSPGHDGVAQDFIKLVTGAKPCIQSMAPEMQHTTFAHVLVELVNAMLRCQHCPDTLKLGVVALLPKPGKDSSVVSNCRPITLLPELGKISNRILAHRFLKTVHNAKTPIFDVAQRAHDKEGTYEQALRTVFHIAQDARTYKAKKKGLVLMSYDVKKAFDTIQFFSIRAACRRYNLPEQFINYVLATLQGARSKVKTGGGLTESFDILTSVRQGDPLSPLIFNMVLDVLHAGFRKNPLFPTEEVRGYRMEKATNPAHAINSVGYADDTIVAAPTWEDAKKQHLWVLEFFAAHHLRLNASKTIVVVDDTLRPSYTGENTDPDPSGLFLPGIEEDKLHYVENQISELDDQRGARVGNGQGRPGTPLTNTRILTYPTSYAFRYLGYQFRMDLDSCDMITAMNKKINLFCKELFSFRLNLLETAACIREVLYPKLELGLLFAHITQKQLLDWDIQVRKATFRGDIGAQLSSIPKELGARSMGILPLEEHRLMLQSTALGKLMRAPKHLPSTFTTTALQQQLESTKYVVREVRAELAWGVRAYTPLKRLHKCVPYTSQLPRVLHALKSKCGIVLTEHTQAPTPDIFSQQNAVRDPAFNLAIQRHVDTCPFYETDPTTLVKLPEQADSGVIIFTDGSYGTDMESNRMRGGYAAIIVPEAAATDPSFTFQQDRIVVLRGGSPGAGKNYSAEGLAIVAAMHALPATTPFTLGTDSNSSKQVLEKTAHWSTNLRLKMGSRPIMVTAQHKLAVVRSVNTQHSLMHIRAHTGNQDFFSRGNAVADREADAAAQDASNIQMQSTPFLVNEERMVGWVQLKSGASFTHISGDLRSTIQSQLEKHIMLPLRDKLSQGLIFCAFPSQCNSMFSMLRRSQDTELFTFFLRAVARRLPTPTVLTVGRERTREALRCVLCGHFEATPAHALGCAAVEDIRTPTRVRVQTHLQAIIEILLRAPALGQDFKAILPSIKLTLAWYNPREPYDPVNFHGIDWEPSSQRDLLHNIDKADRYASMLGFIPVALKQLLNPPFEEWGFPEHSHRVLRKHIASLWVNLRLALLRGSLNIFSVWKQRVQNYYTSNNLAHDNFTAGFAR